MQRDWHVEEGIVRRRASKSIEIDGNSAGDDACDRGKAPAKLYVAREEMDEEIRGNDEDKEHHGTCWIA